MSDETEDLHARVQRLERDFEDYREWRKEVKEDIRALREDLGKVAERVDAGLRRVEASLANVVQGALNSMPAWGSAVLYLSGLLAAAAAVWAFAVHQ